jgi:hypothetical protein
MIADIELIIGVRLYLDEQKSMEGTETKINGGYVSVPSIDF